MKDVMTSFDIAAATLEFAQVIRGAMVDNIYQISPMTLLLRLRRLDRIILIEAGRRIHLSSYKIEKPPTPPHFCRCLRKYLRGGIVGYVKQHEFERIVSFEISNEQGAFKLIAEIFGKGNIILVNKENQILHALTYRRMRDRNILRGEPFRHAPTSGLNPIKITRQQLGKLREYKGEVVRGLTSLISIGGTYAEEILLNAGVTKDKPCDALSEGEIDRIFEAILRLTSKLSIDGLEPCIVVGKDEKWVDVLPFPLAIYRDLRIIPYKTFNEAADDYFTRKASERGAELLETEVKGRIKEHQRILQQQERQLNDLLKGVKENQSIGNLIYTHLSELQLLLQTIVRERRSEKGWNEIIESVMEEREKGTIPAKYLESISPRQGIVTINIDGIRFKLDIRLSIQENATRYYDRSKRAKEKLEGLSRALAKTKEILEKLEKRQVEVVEELPKPVKKRERAWYEKFHWFYTSEGFLVIGGRDATTNELLIKRHMEPQDIVLHADIPGAPFVLVKTRGDKPSEKSIFEAAQLAASYSRAWRVGLVSIDVYWVKPEQISKEVPSGEYIGKGMFMIYGSKNYVHNVPLRVAIGVKEADEELRVTGGAPSAIASQTRFFVEIVPGKLSSGKLAKLIQYKFAQKASDKLREKVKRLPVEDFQRFIPAGRGEIAIS